MSEPLITPELVLLDADLGSNKTERKKLFTEVERENGTAASSSCSPSSRFRRRSWASWSAWWRASPSLLPQW